MHCSTFQNKSIWRILPWNLFTWFIWALAQSTWTVTSLLPLLSSKLVPKACSIKQVFLKFSQNWQVSTSAKVYLLITLQLDAYNFIKNENLIQVFSCQFYEIFKITYFIAHLRTPSVNFLLITFSYYDSELYFVAFRFWSSI